MSDVVELALAARQDVGKGASRRLRREQDLVPVVLYGGNKDAVNLTAEHRVVKKALENEAFYSSLLNLNVDGKKEQAVLKAVQRHPSKPVIMHLDFLRVKANQEITMNVPLHFMNQETAKGVKAGGIISHIMNDVEIKCVAKDLPEFIEVDLANVELDQTVHLSDLKLPKGVTLTAEIDADHDLPVANIHTAKAAPVEEESAPAAEGGESAGEESAEG